MNNENRTILTVILFLEFIFYTITFATATPRAVARCGLNQLPAVLCLAICGGIPTVFLIRKASSRRPILLCLGILSVGIWYGAYVINAMRWEKSGYFCLSQIAANSCLSMAFTAYAWHIYH